MENDHLEDDSPDSKNFNMETFSIIATDKQPLNNLERIEKYKKFLKNRFPISKWILDYSLDSFKGDLVAGLVTGMMMITQAIGVSFILNIPSIYGLNSCLFGSMIYMLMGTSKDMSIGPTVLVGIVTSLFVPTGSYIHASVMAFLVGLLMFAISAFNLGFLMNFISKPVIEGFISCAALSIILSQLPTLFGINLDLSPSESPVVVFIHFWQQIKTLSYLDSIIGVVSLVIFLLLTLIQKLCESSRETNSLFSRLVKNIMWTLCITKNAWFTAIAVCFTYYYVNYQKYLMEHNITNFITNHNITLCPSVEASFPSFKVPFLSKNIHQFDVNMTVSGVFSDAAKGFSVVCIIALIEHISVAQKFAKLSSYKLSNNQEILALGVINLLNSFFGGFPVSGSLSRSAVNRMTGVKTPLSGLFSFFLIIIVISFSATLFHYIPKPFVAALIMTAVSSMINFSFILSIIRIHKWELIPWLGTFGVGLYSLEYGIIAGIALSDAIITYRELRPRVKYTTDISANQAYIYIRGNVHFPGAKFVVSRINKVVKENCFIRKIYINCSGMFETDISVALELLEAISLLELKNISVILININDGNVSRIFNASGLQKYIQLPN